MSMIKIPKFPKKMEELLGADGKDEFIDFLNDSFSHQEDNVLQVVSDRFDRRVTEESSLMKIAFNNLEMRVTEQIARLDIRLTKEVTFLDTRITKEISKVNDSISNLDKRVTAEIAGVNISIANLKSELKSDITNQTRWIVAILLAGTVIYPVVNQLMLNFFQK